MSETPKWIDEARLRYYDNRSTLSLETNIRRTSRIISILSQKVLPSLNSSIPVRILDVGIGLDAQLIECPYEPYRIAAYLENASKDYRMSLLDKDAETINDILSRRRIYLLQGQASALYTEDDQKADNQAWDEYLAHTAQPMKLIYERDEWLKFKPWIKAEEIDRFLKAGIKTADIPRFFQRKLETGQTVIQHQDVARAELNSHLFAPYHFIIAQLVLPYLQEDGQRLALYNMALATEKNGFILIDNLKLIMPWMSFVFKHKNGGWITEEILSEIGLHIEERYPISDTYDIYLLRRI